MSERPAPRRGRSLLPAALEIAIAALAGAALAAAFAGPVRLALGDATLSVRTLTRPLAAAALLAGWRLWMDRRQPAAALSAAGRVTLGAILAASVLGWTIFLSPTVGGADSYGYVNAAQRLLEGRLIQHEPLASAMPFPSGINAAAALGSVPSGRVADASVPVYPLGLPAVMAAALFIGGASAPFWVAPAMGLLLVIAVGRVARVWFADGTTALVAAALTAANPLVFTYAIQPMSDAPAAATLLGAVAALSGPRPRTFLAGLLAALTMLIRPALALAAGALVVIVVLQEAHRRTRSALTYAAPVAVAALLQGWSQWYLYGDPLAAGYGRIASLFTLDTALTNLAIFARWTVPTFGIVWLAAVAFGIALSARGPRRVLATVALAVSLPYVFYRPYDHWETLRFLLPIVCVATAMSAAGLVSVARRVARIGAAAVIVAIMVATIAWGWTRWLATNQVFTMPVHEARHRLAGEMVAQTTPATAVIIALQHSGSLRYYSGRQTLIWTGIPAGAFDVTVRALKEGGHAVYVMIDSDAERAQFAELHGRALEGWLPAGQRRSVQLFEAR